MCVCFISFCIFISPFTYALCIFLFFPAWTGDIEDPDQALECRRPHAHRPWILPSGDDIFRAVQTRPLWLHLGFAMLIDMRVMSWYMYVLFFLSLLCDIYKRNDFLDYTPTKQSLLVNFFFMDWIRNILLLWNIVMWSDCVMCMYMYDHDTTLGCNSAEWCVFLYYLP